MSLAALFAASGETVGTVSAKLGAAFPGFDSDLLVRVDQDRQPLSLEVADAIASALSTDRATVLSEVARSTPINGPQTRRPRPPRLGDEVKPAVYSPTIIPAP